MTLKKKIITLAVFLLVLSILLIVFVISPLFSEIKRISRDFPTQKQNLAALQKEVENLEKFKRDWPEISSDLERVSHLFFINDPKALIDFRNFWKKNAQNSQVSLEISLASSPRAAEADLWPSTIFNLTAAGSFSSLLNFLEKLQSSDYLIDIQALNITRLTEGDVKALILIKVYNE
jgi:type III secretory pathway component EscR